MSVPDSALAAMAERLAEVPGVVGVTLGGSRARGDHHAGSDTDLGLYYRPPLDVTSLGRLAREVAGPEASVTAPGAWGLMVDGGGWLDVEGMAVDWIYRDLHRVDAAWREAQAGIVSWWAQAGHPLGVPGFVYAGELALARVLVDPSGELAARSVQMRSYPPALAGTLIDGLWEAGFLVEVARKGASRADSAYVAGCLFRAVALCAHALHARAGRWLVNEKGAVAAAGRLDLAPTNFAERAQRLLAAPGSTAPELAVTLDRAAGLVEETRVAVA